MAENIRQNGAHREVRGTPGARRHGGSPAGAPGGACHQAVSHASAGQG